MARISGNLKSLFIWFSPLRLRSAGAACSKAPAYLGALTRKLGLEKRKKKAAPSHSFKLNPDAPLSFFPAAPPRLFSISLLLALPLIIFFFSPSFSCYLIAFTRLLWLPSLLPPSTSSSSFLSPPHFFFVLLSSFVMRTLAVYGRWHKSL